MAKQPGGSYKIRYLVRVRKKTKTKNLTVEMKPEVLRWITQNLWISTYLNHVR